MNGERATRPNSPISSRASTTGRDLITPLFNAGERVLAKSMKGYWGAFVRQGVPSDKTDAAWPIFNAAGQLKSLQENDRSFVLSTEQFKREHDCKFRDENEQ